jgi:hypothetical protein
MLKKAASGVLEILPCSRTSCTLRASTKGAPYGTQQAILRPSLRHGSGQDWTDFFEHSLQLMMAVSSWACICHGSEIFNSPIQGMVSEFGIKKGEVFWTSPFFQTFWRFR